MKDAEGPVENACAICGASATDAVMVRSGDGRLVRCADCGSWTYLPRQTPEAQAGLHDTAGYFEHPYFNHRRESVRALQRVLRETFARIATGVDLQSLRGLRLLDVGCDTGAFLDAAAQQFGIVPVGVDVSARAVQEATRRGIEAYHANLETAPGHLRNLAVITAIDLIEHVVSPREFLQQVYARLRPGGVAYLETPNIASVVYRAGRLLSRMTGGRPRGVFERLFPRQHAQYFTLSSLRTLAQACGFEVVRLDTRPLPFRAIGTALPVRIGIVGLQMLDMLTRSNRILVCALLRRPRGTGDA